MPVTVDQLIQEMKTRITTESVTFSDKGFYIYNLEDLEEVGLVTMPLVGISYEGAEVRDQADGNNRGGKGVAMVTISVSVILALEYRAGTLSSDDPKSTATDLLDEIRVLMLGFKGVNSRPWRFAGEAPTAGDVEGVIFYSQLWETDISSVGSFTQT